MTVDPVEQKRKLREQLRALRRALSPEEAKAETAATVATCERLLTRYQPPAIASYLATGSELDLDELHQRRWRVALAIFIPRISAPGQLSWHPMSARAQARPGSHGIDEPDPAVVSAAALPKGTLLFVPGVGYAADGRRLGQSGGYYDRLLAGLDGIAIGVGFACQRCDEIPVEPHDRGVHGVVLGGKLLLDPTKGLTS